MAACAENLTPMVAECGGKDALIVGADADLDAAADAAAWGALSNAGQTCVGVERVYVAEDVYHSFLEKLTERMSEIRPGDDREADYGPMTLPGQVEVVERHIADALARGGTSGRRRTGEHPQAVRRPGDPHRGSRGEPCGHRGDLRAHGHRHPGGRPRRGRPAGEREPIRARVRGVRAEQEGGDGRGPRRCAAG